MVVDEASCYADHTLPGIVRYAQKCGARVHITTTHKPLLDVKSHPQWQRLDILYNALSDPTWDQLLVMDIDIHVNPHSPDIFDLHPSGFNVCEDLFLKITPSYDKFQAWLSNLGLSGPCLNGGVILTDRPSLQKLSPWLQIKPFVGPFNASDQNHENLAIKHTFPDLVPMDIKWNTPDPHATWVNNGDQVVFEEAYFRHVLEVRGWKAKDLHLGRMANSHRQSLPSLVPTMTSILCLPRIVRLAGLKVGHISPNFGDVLLGPNLSLSSFLCQVTDAKLVGEEHLSLCDFALMTDGSKTHMLPKGALVALPKGSAEETMVELEEIYPVALMIKPF